MAKQFVAYYRLSKESRSGGLGLDAQKDAVATYLKSVGGVLIREFTEIESGRKNSRVELQEAIRLCRRSKACLCIAKLDRLARNTVFLLTLRNSGVDVVAVDFPFTDKLSFGIRALFAEHEADVISRRTREALAEARKRGVRLGSPKIREIAELGRAVNRAKAEKFAGNILPVIAEIERAGVRSLQGIADALNARGVQTATGREFRPQTVANILARRNRTHPPTVISADA